LLAASRAVFLSPNGSAFAKEWEALPHSEGATARASAESYERIATVGGLLTVLGFGSEKYGNRLPCAGRLLFAVWIFRGASFGRTRDPFPIKLLATELRECFSGFEIGIFESNAFFYKYF